MLKSLLNTFFPKVCGGCNSPLLASENVICTDCRHEIPLTNHHLSTDNEALTKFYGRIPVEFAGAFIYFHKKGIVQQLVHNLKYRGHQEIGTAVGLWYGETLANSDKLKDVDFIIPVPLHRKRLRERGYNQVDYFGKALSETLGIPLSNDLLVRNIYSKTQTRKNLLGRAEVSETSIFGILPQEKYSGKHFLLIDDVLTTGSTLEACGRELLKIPGSRISIVCMAMSHS